MRTSEGGKDGGREVGRRRERSQKKRESQWRPQRGAAALWRLVQCD